MVPGSEALSRKWLSKMPDVCRGDAALVRLVIRRDGVALQHATDELKAERAGWDGNEVATIWGPLVLQVVL